jgi:hypothetical protein
MHNQQEEDTNMKATACRKKEHKYGAYQRYS